MARTFLQRGSIRGVARRTSPFQRVIMTAPLESTAEKPSSQQGGGSRLGTRSSEALELVVGSNDSRVDKAVESLPRSKSIKNSPRWQMELRSLVLLVFATCSGTDSSFENRRLQTKLSGFKERRCHSPCPGPLGVTGQL
ncbi:unnamed protein product [Pleuronectes platessa]|uniref:Uncharacterized protein n=1 Tax=Pleuronectes platessa TaxID=8262 RepID=A0A9N7VV42_PLEPL|nr:unnamed protein product [Pleuronectes platessa]